MFFQAIDKMMTPGVDLTLVIRKNEGVLSVSTLPRANCLMDNKVQNQIVPLNISGAPQELDAGFLSAAYQPLQRACGLLSNLVQFEEQTSKAASNSKETKEPLKKEPKEAKEKRERYNKYIKKADELIAAHNYADALTNLQQARLCATENALETVDEKIAVVKTELKQGSLFELPSLTPDPQAIPAQSMSQQQTTNPQAVLQPQRAQPMAQQAQYQPQAAEPQYASQAQPYGPPQQQYAAQPYQQAPPQQAYAQHPYQQSYAQIPAYPAQSHPEPVYPPYRPDEYAEYPDFPSDMVNQTYNPNQTY